jgi:hypothetical protein
VANARAAAEKAIAIDGRLPSAKLMAAEACLHEATMRRSAAAVQRGITYVEQALALNPRLAGAETVRAALLRL